MINRVVITIGKHVVAQQALACGGEGVGIEEAGEGGVVVAGLEVIEAGFGWILLCTRRGMTPPGFCFRMVTCRKRERRCCVPASIADVIPRHLSGRFLKPLRDWDYPNNSAFCPQKAMLAGMLRHLQIVQLGN